MEHSPMFEKIKNYYRQGLWTYEMVQNAVTKGKITEEEFVEIVGEN